jgi:nuclear transport factor 2 (NTF2) superfamily protein
LVDFDPAVGADLRRALTELYAAFNVRDVEIVLRAVAPDVVWSNGWEGGAVRGREEVRAYWTRQWAEIDPTVEPVDFRREQDGRVAVTVRQVVRDRAGTVIAEGHVGHVYRFGDGLVQDMEIRSCRGEVEIAADVDPERGGRG